MRTIALTQGKVALVDDMDYEFLNQWKWCASRKREAFYAVRHTSRTQGKRKLIYMHRVVDELGGIDTQNMVDHINRNGLDNRRLNLRSATRKQNAENQGLASDNTSGFRGISWYKRDSKWQASIRHQGKGINLGRFDKLEDAVAARQEAEELYFTHGEAK